MLSCIRITSVHLHSEHSCQVPEPVCWNVFPVWDSDTAVYTEPIVVAYLLLALVINSCKEGLLEQCYLTVTVH